MAEKPRATLADYVVIALSPALIMGLVGSLVFFLLEVFYRGQYGSNLRWILFFYVFGAVLAARVTLMGEIAGRGHLYAAVLGVLTWIGSLRFADLPPDNPAADFAGLINLGLVVLIWWCSYKLVLDCTNIDDKTDIDAAGLLEASGLEDHEQKAVPAGDVATDTKKKGWLDRWFAYVARRKKKRTPGVWVVYFSLAALPLFGLGQTFVPPDAGARREYTFWLLVLYLACGLGLLLTTCFLGLRRYLRQRKLRMPPAMAGAWLAIGAGIVVGLLGVMAFVPRPEAGYSLLKDTDGADRQASENAVVKDGKGKDSKNPTGKADKDGQPGNQRDKDGPGKDKDKGKGDKDGQKDRGANKDRKDSRAGGQKDAPSKQARDGGPKKEGEKEPSSAASPLRPLTHFLQSIGPWLKWIVFGILALVVLFWLLRGGLRYLANFTEWARKLLEWWRRFWASLFGGTTAKEEGAIEKVKVAPARTYKSYPDPFLTGSAASMDAREMVRYTFAALQAWGRERGIERKPDETPLEYAGRLAAEVPDLETEIRKLASLYARAVYGFAPLPETTEDFLRAFWQTLDAATRATSTSAS